MIDSIFDASPVYRPLPEVQHDLKSFEQERQNALRDGYPYEIQVGGLEEQHYVWAKTPGAAIEALCELQSKVPDAAVEEIRNLRHELA